MNALFFSTDREGFLVSAYKGPRDGRIGGNYSTEREQKASESRTGGTKSTKVLSFLFLHFSISSELEISHHPLSLHKTSGAYTSLCGADLTVLFWTQ